DRGAAVADSSVRVQHRRAGDRGVPVARGAADRVLLVPALLRAGSARRLRQVGTAGTQMSRKVWISAPRLLSRVARSSDRKSTRLNSSHVKSSYAVFCLKKKNIYLSVSSFNI